MNQCIITCFLLLASFFQGYTQDSNEIVIGNKHQIHSDILNEERSYWVGLPESYNDETASYKRYPILLVLDGHAHFRSISGMVNYMSSGYNGNIRIPEMIVVAIQNVNRRRDFTPDKIITQRENDSGGGETFLRFLEEELIPELDKQYRSDSYRILFGHSLGGLLATHTYMKEQTKFNAFIAVDPSLGTWDAETMDEKLEAITTNSFHRYLYVATANWGKSNIRNRDRHIRLYESLNSKCTGFFPAALEYFEEENHGSVPLIAFHNGISSIFKGYGVHYRNIQDTEELKEHFINLSDRLSWVVKPPEYLVNRIGYTLLKSKDKINRTEALQFFILNTELYPASYNTFDSLEEAYEIMSDNKNAVINYNKSLKLNPGNKHALRKIQELKE
jgi:predicted alpha/beta superfamily hydrolase